MLFSTQCKWTVVVVRIMSCASHSWACCRWWSWRRAWPRSTDRWRTRSTCCAHGTTARDSPYSTPYTSSASDSRTSSTIAPHYAVATHRYDTATRWHDVSWYRYVVTPCRSAIVPCRYAVASPLYAVATRRYAVGPGA